MTLDAEMVVIAYGCVARSARRAVLEARSQGMKVGMLKLITLWPFPRTYIQHLIKAGKTLLVPEMNMGQVSREVKRVNEGMTQVLTLNKIDGTIITPKEILAKMKEKR
jgi:2-oxoglutarate ferredoxin oxidoreductase subunit alpha